MFSSCEKDSDQQGPSSKDYYFSARLNGELNKFVYTAQFQYGEKNGNIISASVHGYEAAYDVSKPIEYTPLNFSVDIFRYDEENISSRTYSIAESYLDIPSLDYRVDGERHIQTKDLGTIQYDGHDLKDFEVTVIELSKEKGFKGTFKGRIKRDRPPYDVITVTGGEFYFPFSQDVLNP